MPLSRREFIGGAVGSAASLYSAMLLGASSAKAKPSKNVLFIAVDDLRPQLGCYGMEDIHSPHIDRLAAEGMVFKQAYCQQAVCSPSRTSLLTGLRPDSTRVYDLHTHFRKTVPDVVTLPECFKNHGAHVVGMGKIYHGSLNDKASWSVPWRRPKGKGYNLAANQTLIRDKRAAARAKGMSPREMRRRVRGPAFESADVPDNAYPDGRLTDMAIESLAKIKDRRFFLGVGFIKPHLPFNCPKRYWNLYDPAKIELADNPFAPKDAPRQALTNYGELRSYHGIPRKGPVPDDLARQLVHGYYACVSFIDAQVGRLLAELDRLGLADDTAVVLWGDHGWKLGEHGLWCKHTNFELDTRSTLIARSPGMKAAGKRTEALTEFVDIYPTLCDLAGVPRPAHLEGTSFAPLLDQPDQPWKSAAFSQYPRGRGVMGYSMRTARYRYTEWTERKTGKVLAAELYDHQTDPDENVNAAASPANGAVVKKLSRMLKAGWRAARPR